MAISRPLLLALLGVALVGATIVAVSSSRTSATDAGAPAASTQTPQAAQTKPAAQLDPHAALQSAFAVDGIKSARFEGSFAMQAKGADVGKLEVSGRFQRGGPTDMPKLDVHAKSDGFGSKLDVGFVSTGDKAYIVSDGTGYQLPGDVWSQAQDARAQGGAAAAGVPALPQLDPAKWVKNVKSEGSEQLDGVETQHVSATLDPAAALGDIGKLSGTTGALGGAGAAGAFKRADLDVWVGKDDKIVRRIDAQLGGQGVTLHLDVRLREVNDPQTIEAPDKVSDSLPAGILGGASPVFSSGLSLATGADAKALELPANDNPQRLARAVKDHRKALLFFHQSRGLDDKATAESVRAADRRTKALVLTDDVRNSKRYGELVQSLGVTQSPSIVIINRDGKAQLIEGYVDSGTLVQELSDAR